MNCTYGAKARSNPPAANCYYSAETVDAAPIYEPGNTYSPAMQAPASY